MNYQGYFVVEKHKLNDGIYDFRFKYYIHPSLINYSSKELIIKINLERMKELNFFKITKPTIF